MTRNWIGVDSRGEADSRQRKETAGNEQDVPFHAILIASTGTNQPLPFHFTKHCEMSTENDSILLISDLSDRRAAEPAGSLFCPSNFCRHLAYSLQHWQTTRKPRRSKNASGVYHWSSGKRIDITLPGIPRDGLMVLCPR